MRHGLRRRDPFPGCRVMRADSPVCIGGASQSLGGPSLRRTDAMLAGLGAPHFSPGGSPVTLGTSCCDPNVSSSERGTAGSAIETPGATTRMPGSGSGTPGKHAGASVVMIEGP